MSFFSTPKPLSEWKWYVRESDHSTHLSPDPVKNGIEVLPPPGESRLYTWDWILNKWEVDTFALKRRAQEKIDQELLRLQKFPASSTRTLYIDSLIASIKLFDPFASPLPVPASLTDEAFFNL